MPIFSAYMPICIILPHLANVTINAGLVMIQSATAGVGRFAEGMRARDSPRYILHNTIDYIIIIRSEAYGNEAVRSVIAENYKNNIENATMLVVLRLICEYAALPSFYPICT